MSDNALKYSEGGITSVCGWLTLSENSTVECPKTQLCSGDTINVAKPATIATARASRPCHSENRTAPAIITPATSAMLGRTNVPDAISSAPKKPAPTGG